MVATKGNKKKLTVVGLIVFSLIAVITGVYVVTRQGTEQDIRNMAAEGDSTKLVIATYNVAASYSSRNANYNTYINWLADYIIEKEIDIIGFQEVPIGRDGEEFDTKLRQALGGKGVSTYSRRGESRLVQIQGYAITNVILSRYPISRYQEFNFATIYEDNNHNIQVAKFIINGKSYRVINHHPNPAYGCNDARGLEYFGGYLQLVLDEAWVDPNLYRGDVDILLGDFNFRREQHCYQDLLDLEYIDSCTYTGDESCKNSVGPYGVDYIFLKAKNTTGLCRFQSAYADQSIDKSDHFPVIATLVDGNCKDYSCIPNCVDKECGDDGCGGSCGTCTGETVCTSGNCVPVDGDEDNVSNDIDINDDGKIDMDDFALWVHGYRESRL